MVLRQRPRRLRFLAQEETCDCPLASSLTALSEREGPSRIKPWSCVGLRPSSAVMSSHETWLQGPRMFPLGLSV